MYSEFAALRYFVLPSVGKSASGEVGLHRLQLLGAQLAAIENMPNRPQEVSYLVVQCELEGALRSRFFPNAKAIYRLAIHPLDGFMVMVNITCCRAILFDCCPALQQKLGNWA